MSQEMTVKEAATLALFVATIFGTFFGTLWICGVTLN